MDKLKMHSPNLTEANIAKLAALFPSCVTEARDEQGRVKQAIDFDQLRQELSDQIVEGPQERYHLNWPGKREALLAANAPIAKTLRPQREESVDFDSTKNLFIEGDNLEAIKLLQESYLEKVGMIYIDPPYNTGREFVYDDDFKSTVKDYVSSSLQEDEEGTRLVVNLESNGRFHSDWLSMMYPRLRLSKNLLKEDGVIFISIDDNEYHNLRKLCDEVFGEDNFIACIVWQKRYVSNVTAKWMSDMHDYILVYAKDKSLVSFSSWERSTQQQAAYKNPDSDPRGVWRAQDLSASKPYMAGLYEIVGPTGKVFSPPPNRYWRCNEKQFKEWDSDNRIWWGVNKDARPMLKSFLDESERGITPHTWWDYSFAGHNKEATLELKEIFDGNSPFDTPKPVKLLKKLVELAGLENSLIMDFFAGSCSLAHAVMENNAEKGSGNRFVVIQMPEPCNQKNDSYTSGFSTVSEIGRERIKRAGNNLVGSSGVEDIGFRYLKVDSTNFRDVFYSPDGFSQDILSSAVDNIKDGRREEDLLFQVLLDWGVDLSLPISHQEIDGKTVFFVDGAEKHMALAACFDLDVDEAFVKQLAEYEPLRVVFRDAGFASDSVKINVEQIFAQKSPNTEVKVL
ncbi:site-specific DNA-methyltransferase [Halomonas sp. ANAO-440]|uniref:site-specific DNA-methyltransferase n=1 Tax=Halomonas sp. ANAO-440 TaxID=2861360 RepID=UPI001CAA4411|nr:site-specific DNA-methyltransferase [Halomonas sp. ANAO-440]MBZ0331674.1 site-specific DNA-methyltransferase [Halomonas sp. ANAO-440]